MKNRTVAADYIRTYGQAEFKKGDSDWINLSELLSEHYAEVGKDVTDEFIENKVKKIAKHVRSAMVVVIWEV